MLESLLAILQQLIPLWLFALVLGFGYLVVLFHRAFKAVLGISERQATFMKERFDVVDLSTGTFERTILQQEREIGQQNEEIETLSLEVAELRAGMMTDRQLEAQRATEGLEFLQEAINTMVDRQELILDSLTGSRPEEGSNETERVSASRSEFDNALAAKLDRSRRTRDRSPYTVKVAHLKGAGALIRDLVSAGYTASAYRATLGDTGELVTIEECGALWVGSDLPPHLVVELIRMARGHYSEISYVRLSRDMSGPDYIHSMFFVGGETETATKRYRCQAWLPRDFEDLSPDMSVSALHDFIRSKYL